MDQYFFLNEVNLNEQKYKIIKLKILSSVNKNEFKLLSWIPISMHVKKIYTAKNNENYCLNYF